MSEVAGATARRECANERRGKRGRSPGEPGSPFPTGLPAERGHTWRRWARGVRTLGGGSRDTGDTEHAVRGPAASQGSQLLTEDARARVGPRKASLFHVWNFTAIKVSIPHPLRTDFLVKPMPGSQPRPGFLLYPPRRGRPRRVGVLSTEWGMRGLRLPPRRRSLRCVTCGARIRAQARGTHLPADCQGPSWRHREARVLLRSPGRCAEPAPLRSASRAFPPPVLRPGPHEQHLGLQGPEETQGGLGSWTLISLLLWAHSPPRCGRWAGRTGRCAPHLPLALTPPWDTFLGEAEGAAGAQLARVLLGPYSSHPAPCRPRSQSLDRFALALSRAWAPETSQQPVCPTGRHRRKDLEPPGLS